MIASGGHTTERARHARRVMTPLVLSGLLGAGAVLVGVTFAVSAYSVHVLALPAVVLAVVMVLVSLSRPEIGIAIAFVLLAMSSGLAVGAPWLPGTAWTGFLLVAALAARGPTGIGFGSIGLAAVTFLIVGVLGVVVSGSPGPAVPLLRSTATGVALLFLVSSQVRTRRDAQWVLGGIAGGGAIVGGQATLQYIRGSGASVGFITDTGELVARVTGGFGQANALAGFLVLVVAIAVGGALIPGPRRPLYALAASVSAIGVYATFSRGALLAMLVLPPVFLGRRRAILVAPLAVLALAVASPSLARERFATLTQGGGEVADRVDFWQTAGSMWAANPVFGVGPGEFATEYAQARVPGKRFLPDTTFEPPPHAHNLGLNVLAEQGVVGFAALAGVLWLAVRSAFRLGGSSERWISVMGRALAASLLAFAVHNLFDVTLNEVTGTYFWGVLGLVAALSGIDRHDPSPVSIAMPATAT